VHHIACFLGHGLRIDEARGGGGLSLRLFFGLFGGKQSFDMQLISQGESD
jgi:hypothetical protein